LSLSDILTPAIRLADNGFPVHEISAYLWDASEKLLKKQTNGHEMLIGNSSAEARAPRAGEMMRMPHLARTFRDLSTMGKEAFYKGRIAREIVSIVQASGGHMELDDLEDHIQRGVDEVQPVHYTYHNDGSEKDGVTLYECPPNGQGLVALLALGILDAAQRLNIVPDLRTLEHNSPEYLHALIEALRLAFADARKFVSDPQHLHNGKPALDLEHVLSASYLESRAKLIDPKRASADPEAGSPFATSDTVYFTVADKDGNACSFINSNYSGFGSCIVPKGCGFTLQNRGSCFSLEEGHSNVYAPRKRPLHTILPAMATRGKELFMSFGVMGGEMQPQGHVQVLLNILHRGFTPQASLDAPRFCIGAGMLEQNSSLGAKNSSTVFLEEGIPEEVAQALKAMGHRIELRTGTGRTMFGRGQIIQRLSTSVKRVGADGSVEEEPASAGRIVWAAGSDPRADGQAVAQI
ncbi:hypothetical protein A4X13_0g2718, partial [Tilletia indica]